MEELLGRRVPWSAEAEQAVLGSCLIDPSCLPDVMTAVRGADFYLPQNREIFETIFSMFTFAKPIDPVTVLDEMKVRGVYHDESSQQYIRELMRLTPTAANVLKYAAIVRDIAQRTGALLADPQVSFDRYFAHCHPMSMSWDYVHPNLTGHMMIAEAIYQALDA